MKTVRTDALAAAAALGAASTQFDSAALDAFDDVLRRGERGELEAGDAGAAAVNAAGEALEMPLRKLLAATQAAAAAAAP